MSNNFYNKSGNPASNSAGDSSLIRAEFTNVQTGFDKLPVTTGNGNKLVQINAAGTALEAGVAPIGDATNLTNTIAPQTHAATGKTTPVDADEIPLTDSAASWGLKKLTWANLKATAKAYFDTLYQAAGTYVTPTTLNNGTLPASVTTLSAGATTVTGMVISSISYANGFIAKNNVAGNGQQISMQAAGDGTGTNNVVITADKIGTGTYPPLWFNVGGDYRIKIDSAGGVTIPGTLALNGASSTLGYGAGAGGAVTQATSQGTTTPTCDHGTGRITMFSAGLGANTTASFFVPNSLVTALDTVVLSLAGGAADSGKYTLGSYATAGYFVVNIRNVTASAISPAEGPVINFTVIKGVIS